MKRMYIIAKTLLKLSNPSYEIPKIPKELEEAITPRDIKYLKYIKKLVTTLGLDPMTGLYHKEHFKELDKGPGAYIFIDGDGLKKLNDTHGHEAGSAAIKALSEGIKKAVRSTGDSKTTRFGGDEFAVYIQDVSIATGVKIAKRILESINKEKIADYYTGSKETKTLLEDYSLKASVGVGKTEAEADKALYVAKDKGRNRVEFFKSQTLH